MNSFPASFLVVEGFEVVVRHGQLSAFQIHSSVPYPGGSVAGAVGSEIDGVDLGLGS